MTGKQLTVLGLQARGFTLDVNARTSKYEVYVRAGFGRRYLVGSSGALRVVMDGKPIASSTSLTGMRAHRAFQELGKVAANVTSVEQADAFYSAAFQSLAVKPELAAAS